MARLNFVDVRRCRVWTAKMHQGDPPPDPVQRAVNPLVPPNTLSIGVAFSPSSGLLLRSSSTSVGRWYDILVVLLWGRIPPPSFVTPSTERVRENDAATVCPSLTAHGAHVQVSSFCSSCPGRIAAEHHRHYSTRCLNLPLK